MLQRPHHLVEMMDVKGLPRSLRHVLTDILEYCNSYFRPYNRWVAKEVLKTAQAEGVKQIVELGAGSAPLTRWMTGDPAAKGLKLTICDIHPDKTLFRNLENRFPELVHPLFESVDYSLPRKWDKGTLLVLNSTFHHVPAERRKEVLRALIGSSEKLLIFEPLKREWGSILYCCLGVFPSLLAPLVLWRPGFFRRFFWCWVVPVAPFLFLFDGIVSCLRMWSSEEWRQTLESLNERGRKFEVSDRFFSHKIAG